MKTYKVTHGADYREISILADYFEVNHWTAPYGTATAAEFYRKDIEPVDGGTLQTITSVAYIDDPRSILEEASVVVSAAA